MRPLYKPCSRSYDTIYTGTHKIARITPIMRQHTVVKLNSETTRLSNYIYYQTTYYEIFW